MNAGFIIGPPKPWQVVCMMLLVSALYLFYLGYSLYRFGH